MTFDLARALFFLELATFVSVLRQPTIQRFSDVVIQFAATPDLPKEKCHCGKAHPENRFDSKLNLLSDLVLDQTHKDVI